MAQGDCDARKATGCGGTDEATDEGVTDGASNEARIGEERLGLCPCKPQQGPCTISTPHVVGVASPEVHSVPTVPTYRHQHLDAPSGWRLEFR